MSEAIEEARNRLAEALQRLEAATIRSADCHASLYLAQMDVRFAERHCREAYDFLIRILDGGYVNGRPDP